MLKLDADKVVDLDATIRHCRGRFAMAGIDLSSVSDLTCVVYLFPHDDDRDYVDIIMRTWCPKAKLEDRSNKYRDQYQSWLHGGWLVPTVGDAVDYDEVRTVVVADSKIINIGLIGVDVQFQGIEFSTKLGEKLGHTDDRPVVIGCTNSFKKIGPVCNEFERRLLARKINHGGNPILRFMADSIAVRSDPDGFRKPDKDKSQGKIDGLVGAMYALDRLMRSKPPPSPRKPIFL